MMATRKTSTLAAINRRIDAINRKANPRMPDFLVVKFGDAVKNASAPETMRDFGRDYFFVQWKRPSEEKWTTHKIVDRADRKEAERVASGLVRSWRDSESPIMVRLVMPSPATGPRRNPARTSTLVARRPKNPMLPEAKSRKPANFPYGVETRATENWSLQAAFKEKAKAVEYAHALAAQYPRLPVRVIHYTGGPIK